MPNPSTTQVIELREQIARVHDAGGADRDHIWALALFSGRRGNTRGQKSHLDPNHGRDGLLGALDHWRRGRCPFPFELPGTCMFDLRLPINGS